MSVHYKFKSNLNFDTLSFDGLHISVGDLKKAIIQQKKLGKVIDYDLQITNAQTKEEYSNDSHLIPKNTSLIISRIPVTSATKKFPEIEEHEHHSRYDSKIDRKTLDLTRLNGSEEEKIQEMMLQSTVHYDPKSYQKFRTQSQMGEVPATYKCNKCKRSGHWIKNCPLANTKELNELKRNTGIPRSFRDNTEKQSEMKVPEVMSNNKAKKIPDDLICSICKDLFVDAVMIPCCGSSFCDDCVRTALLESEDNECPDCKEKGSSPGALIPNRFLRNSVNAFKNENEFIPENKTKNLAKSDTGDNIAAVAATSSSENLKVNIPTVETRIDENVDAKISSPNEEIESDFEDNIVVKVPVIESATANHSNVTVSPNQNISQEKLKSVNENSGQKNNFNEDTNLDSLKLGTNRNNSTNEFLRTTTHRSEVPDRRMLPEPRINHFPQYQMYPQVPQFSAVRGQAHGCFENFYNRPTRMPPIGYPNMVHQPVNELCSVPYMPLRPPPMENQKSSNVNNFSNIYEGISSKLGSGIIDDPLEAFNRIMKEKEEEKEQKRRQAQRRSRSIDRQKRRHARSPSYDHRASKQFVAKESRLPRKRQFDKKHNIKSRRSNSPKNSRSRSRSPLHLRARSPVIVSRQSQYHRRSKNMEKYQRTESPGKSKHISSYRMNESYRENTIGNLEPPPPGSEAHYAEENRKSRSPAFRGDEKKSLFKRKHSPITESALEIREDQHHYTPEPIDRVTFSVTEFSQKSNNISPKNTLNSNSSNLGTEENASRINVTTDVSANLSDVKKSNYNSDDTKAGKDDLKSDKKNKDRKKKKKEKVLKKKNKKEKKEKKTFDKLKSSPRSTRENEVIKNQLEFKNEERSNLEEIIPKNIEQEFTHVEKFQNVTSPNVLKVSDSILDIQGYDTDFEDIVIQEKKKKLIEPIQILKDGDKSKNEVVVKVGSVIEAAHKNNNESAEIQGNIRNSAKAVRSVKERLGNKVMNNAEDSLHRNVMEIDKRLNYDVKRERSTWYNGKSKDKWRRSMETSKSPAKKFQTNNYVQSRPLWCPSKNLYHSSKREFVVNSKTNDIKSVASKPSTERKIENPFRSKSPNESKTSSIIKQQTTNRKTRSRSSSESNSNSSEHDREKKVKSKRKHKKRRSSISPDSEDSLKRRNTKNKKKHKLVKRKKKNK